MKELIDFKPSTREGKKYMMILNIDGKGKTIHFGSKNSKTYLDHRDKDKREAYLKRHAPNENWDEINPASASRYVLWGSKTELEPAIKSYLKRFNIKDIR